MKKSILYAMLVVLTLVFFGCESVPKGSLGYKEMTEEEFEENCKAVGGGYTREKQQSKYMEDLYDDGYAGLKISGVLGKNIKKAQGWDWYYDSYYAGYLRCDEYYSEHPDTWERLDNDREYVVQIRIKREYQSSSYEYRYSGEIENIEGLRPLEEIQAEKEAAKRAEEEKKAAEDKAKDEKGKALANGYIYHGIDEADNNYKLFSYGALESGHAYYIKDFGLISNETAVGRNNEYIYVTYIDQQTRGKVLDASSKVESAYLFGQLIYTGKRSTVVVAGGKGYSKTPVVLGLVE